MSAPATTPCPWCGYVIDVASQVIATDGLSMQEVELDNMRPHDGAWSVCMACATPSVFMLDAFGVRMTQPDEEQWDEMRRDPNLVTTVFGIVEARARLSKTKTGWPRSPLGAP